MLEVGDQTTDGETGVASLAGWARALNGPAVLRSRDWLGVFQGHEIRVVTRGLLRARLYLDGELRDKRSPLLCLDRRVPLLTGRLTTVGFEVTIVYVYPRGLWPTHIGVRIAGKPVPMNLCLGSAIPKHDGE